jgi:hypothetical protein
MAPLSDYTATGLPLTSSRRPPSSERCASSLVFDRSYLFPNHFTLRLDCSG